MYHNPILSRSEHLAYATAHAILDRYHCALVNPGMIPPMELAMPGARRSRMVDDLAKLILATYGKSPK